MEGDIPTLIVECFNRASDALENLRKTIQGSQRASIPTIMRCSADSDMDVALNPFELFLDARSLPTRNGTDEAIDEFADQWERLLRAILDHVGEECTTVVSAFSDKLDIALADIREKLLSQNASINVAHQAFCGSFIVFVKELAAVIEKQPVSHTQSRTVRGRPRNRVDAYSGISQEEAAALCGVAKRTIGRWDNGKNTPADYPGRDDAVKFKAWCGRRQEGKRLKQAIRNAVSYNPNIASHQRLS